MINILCSTDDNYVPYCGIMLTSLFENNKDDQITVFLLTGGLSDFNISTLLKLATDYSQSIKVIKVDEEVFKDCPIDTAKDHVSIATYYRLAVTTLLPEQVDKILYLDCDMIICDSISKLYNTNLEGYACGAVKDEAFMADAPYDRLCIKKDRYHPYFNAGMLLINMSYWREHRIMEKCMEYISNNMTSLAFHDQDTLNIVLREKIRHLPICYNLQTGFLVESIVKDYNNDLKKELMESALSAIIIHFTGPSKPWMKKFRHPFVKKFLHYRSISPFANKPKLLEPQESFKDKLLYFRNKMIWLLGLKKRPWAYIIPEQS